MSAPWVTGTAPARRRHGVPPLSHDRQRAVVLAALLTVVVEILGLLHLIPDVSIGRITMSPSVVPSMIVLALLGQRALGRPRSREAAGPFWVAAAIGVAFGTIMLAADSHLLDAPAVALASLDEEAVFRFAVPTVVAAILLSMRVGVRPARIAGFVVGAVWFVALPGHRAQMSDPAQVLPFIAFAALAALVVYRSGSLIATAAAHTVMNMLTILALLDELGRTARGLAIGCLLVLLVAAFGQPRRATTAAGADAEETSGLIDLTEPLGDGNVIDLRDGVEPTVSDRHGNVTPLNDPAEAESEAGTPR